MKIYNDQLSIVNTILWDNSPDQIGVKGDGRNLEIVNSTVMDSTLGVIEYGGNVIEIFYEENQF